jgi:hypothetical protein
MERERSRWRIRLRTLMLLIAIAALAAALVVEHTRRLEAERRAAVERLRAEEAIHRAQVLAAEEAELRKAFEEAKAAGWRGGASGR